ncbi:hypothetical protein GJ629_03580 [Halapricum sp. CBA1109]|uniref:DUF6276 family protein n=1 Tax=Halapricum sp. CBA1109 TaxID=2668068 RepID=UPI0012FC7FE3|nr:DUF6276 family protein [Halapricum sp. CBA1109]MUV89095.1 hypothetical protein [Halapricum sp. CBA1109]
MECSECDGVAVAYPVPDQYRSLLPEATPGAATCTRCLAIQPVTDPPDDHPDYQRISEAFPSDPDAAVPMAIALGLLSSLALNRQAITDLLAAVERAGSDPMLVVSRLVDDTTVDPHVDLVGRRRQLEQLR